MDMDESKTVVWDGRARETLDAMYAHVWNLRRHFGESSPHYLKAAASLMKVLAQIALKGFSDTAKVSRDGTLSLYVIEGTFHYGIIWFRDRDFDDQPDVPQPGEWSMHS